LLYLSISAPVLLGIRDADFLEFPSDVFGIRVLGEDPLPRGYQRAGDLPELVLKGFAGVVEDGGHLKMQLKQRGTSD